MKTQVKRKLIASFVYDLGTTDFAKNIPHVSVSWCLNEEKPFLMIIKLDNRHFEYKFMFDKKMLYGLSLNDIAKKRLKKNFNYNGKLELDPLNGYYLSEFGKCVFAANSKKQIDGWMKQFKVNVI